MKKIIFAIMLTLLWTVNALAVTEFTVTVKTSGGDFTGLWGATGNTNLRCDITASTTKVFAISNYTGTVAGGNTVTGQTSGATATVAWCNVAHTQILLKSISGTFQSGEVVQVSAGNSVTLTNAGDSAIVGVQCISGNDTGSANVAGTWTTSATNYIHIYTPIANRHGGYWDAAKYNLTVTSTSSPNLYLSGGTPYVVVDGLQLATAGTAAAYVFRVDAIGALTIKNCLIKSSASSTFTTKMLLVNVTGGNYYFYNNVVYDMPYTGSEGIDATKASANLYVYNNTWVNIATAIYRTAGNIYLKNNIFSGCATVGNGAMASGTNYNSTDSSSVGYTGGGANDLVSQTFTFLDSATKNFAITSSDTGAKDKGESLDADASLPFNTDILGVSRPQGAAWDIGAFELTQSGTNGNALWMFSYNATPLTKSLTVPLSISASNQYGGPISYIINESATPPAVADGSWNTTTPTSYTFSSTGTKTLYAWVKDYLGNINSGTASITVIPASNLYITTANPTVKVRPYSQPTSTTSINVQTAQDEYSSGQISVWALQESLNNVDISLSLPEGITATVYKEGQLHVVTPSFTYGDTGEWPDPLIPKVDAYYGETRNAFPFSMTNVSPAYQLWSSLPYSAYGAGRGSGTNSSVDPPSGYVYPFTGATTSSTNGGTSNVYNAGIGNMVTGGTYTGAANIRYIVIIDSGGALGAATFKWSSDNGSTFTTGVATSSSPITLNNGVTVAFAGAGTSSDFITNDEFVFYAGPTRNQTVWIDFFVPHTVAAGTYSGTATITANGLTTATVPISFTVWGFQLPARSSIPNYFGNATWTFAQAHAWGADVTTINNLYVMSALKHRMDMPDEVQGGSPWGTCTSYNESTGAITMDFTNFDNVYSQFLNPTGTSTLPTGFNVTGVLGALSFTGGWFLGPSSHFTYFSAGSCSKTNDKLFFEREMGALTAHLKANNWFDRFFIYAADEPGFTNTAIWVQVNNSGQFMRESDAQISQLLTSTNYYGLNHDYAYVTLTGTPGTTITNGKVQDTLSRLWDLPTTTIIGSDGTVTTTATCENQSVSTGANTLTTINTPVAGWTSVTNANASSTSNDFVDIYVSGPYRDKYDASLYNYCPMSNYASWLNNSSTPKKQVWYYFACTNCNGVAGTSWDGYPNYYVDGQGIYSRVFPWMVRWIGSTGMLYYSTNYTYYRQGRNGGAASGNTSTGNASIWGTCTSNATPKYVVKIISGGAIGTATFQWSETGGATWSSTISTGTTAIALSNGMSVSFSGASVPGDFVTGDTWSYIYYDPWKTLYWFGNNGDGTLFYPGTPARIGGTHDIPIESLRMKHIRAGVQDYEYMHLLDTQGKSSWLQSQLNSLITTSTSFNTDPTVYDNVRSLMAGQILDFAPMLTNGINGSFQ